MRPGPEYAPQLNYGRSTVYFPGPNSAGEMIARSSVVAAREMGIVGDAIRAAKNKFHCANRRRYNLHCEN
ncbi:hypothetical protein [Meleagrid alphaherpesvirus 1]|uniref:Uncharacterized protein HVT004 n=1 Tax=Meleagrid herpesvirus 1 TaxID=37108 RepID=Q9DGX6_MEHV1|nr:hypothetical protein [Meleagrid alphaherpesvirus 1]AAG45825.1 hypothetical protein [Meleagrid alphaherpesvirus 1]